MLASTHGSIQDIYLDHLLIVLNHLSLIANLDTNAALTNQVFAYLVGPVQPTLDICVATGDKERYRGLITPVFAEWVRQCPQANSPQATSDPQFQQRQVNYLLECMVAREFDPSARQVGLQLVAATRALQRIPQPDGSYRGR